MTDMNFDIDFGPICSHVHAMFHLYKCYVMLFLTPGAWLAGFIKRTTIHCYIHNIKALGLVVSEKKSLIVFPMMPPGGACINPRGTVGRIYKEDHYTLLHTKYESSRPCSFREEVFFCFFFSHCKSMGANAPQGRTIFVPRGMVGRIYIEYHYTLLHAKYESSRPCGFGEEDFFPRRPGAGPVWTPRACLTGFIKRAFIHCYTQNMKGLCLVVLEKKIFFNVFPLYVYGSN